MSDREYRAVRSSRPGPRESYDEIEPVSRQRPRGDSHYDDPYAYPRGSRDALSRTTTRSEHGSLAQASDVPSATKTTYRIARDRDSDAYVTRGKVIVLDSRLDRDRELSDWEVIRPERSESGAYVIETSSTSDYDTLGRRQEIGYDERRRPTGVRDTEVLAPPRGRRERSMSRGTVQAMREVRVTEDYSSEDDHRDTRKRRTARPKTNVETDAAVVALPLTRPPSSIRHDHSPESDTRRRSRSIGFIRDQLSHHDVSESRHERPGAEANIAGKYLIDHRGERVRRGDGDDDSTAVGKYPLRKSRTEGLDTYGAEVERRRHEGRLRGADSRYEEEEDDRRSGPYPPQKDRRRYRPDNYEDSRYSEYYDNRTSKKYY